MLPPRTFSEKLRGEMERRGMGARTLARLIDPENVEQARKSVRRWLKGTVPTQANRDLVTDALGLERGALDSDDEEDDVFAPLMRAVRDVLANDQVRDELRQALLGGGDKGRT